LRVTLISDPRSPAWNERVGLETGDPMASVAALIVGGAFLFFLGVFAGLSDIGKLALFAMGVGSFIVAGILEVAGRRTA
jgi:hypothetical protein